MPARLTRPPASRRVKIIVWGNILFQLLFPLSLSFTPVMAAAPTSLMSNTSIPTTEPYVLGVGENVDTVAKRFGISVDELKKINVYRTFSKPFTAVTPGDELDVPRRVSPFSVDNDKTNTDRDTSPDQALAGYAQTGATALASGDVAQSAAQMARSAVNNEFNSSAQQWLSQFGTARVQMNVNEDFHLDGSAVDVLVPLYDNQSSILFTQLGARNKDSRNTVNIGAGVRTFQNNWMYGMNTFFDNDVTGKNRRVGVGVEAWTDYLKLSANSYLGTTDWHQSRDFADYNERPANGYDVRVEAYLPAYPQLGGKLMYEQYRGDEVALFGKDNRQKNPHAVTAGINYTPVPLFTVGAEHRAGKGSKNDSSINFQLNYRLGESWQSHISLSGGAASRTLAGSRYDLVERNNNIVLDYQKQELIRLSLPEQVTGESSSRATVNAQVTSKYGLERIEWDSAGLMAAGGSLVQVSPQTVSVTLPPYQATRSSNSHTLSAVAYDRQGNTSPWATMQIVVTPGSAELTASNLTVTADNALANGTATNTVQALVTDANGNPVAGQAVVFSANNGASLTTESATTDTSGLASTTLTSTTTGVSTVTATVNGSSQSVDTTFVPSTVTITGVLVNGTTFAVDAGFPSTGFTGAEFTLTISGVASDYTWSSSASSWAPVDSSGKVRFTSQGNASPVTITATPTGGGAPLTYTFMVGSWFTNNGSTAMNWNDASTFCTSQGLQQPTRKQLVGIGTQQAGSQALWSEWGSMGLYYSGSAFLSYAYWTSEGDGLGDHYYTALLINGRVLSDHHSANYYVVCRQDL
ncbi:YrIlm family inverse autotransporter adhesin [Yersinia massiliensis]|uniref:YrIlm family inverse autotransporter adhesin n=1 Tax=Yersinia massiliensis TaxID=419257 RepID=UPI00117E8B80